MERQIRISSSRNQISLVVLLGLLALQTALVGTIACRKSVTNDEIAHLPAAVLYLQYQRFELYRVNPPLARYVAGVPVVLAGCETDWSSFDPSPGSRCEWTVGHDFIKANEGRYLFLLRLARLGCLPFLWLGTWVIWRWAGEIGGVSASIVAAALWVIDPNVLGNAALFTCDVPATCMGVLAAWRFSRWLSDPNGYNAYVAGLCAGLAMLTKTVWIILPPLWFLLWILTRLSGRRSAAAMHEGRQLLICGTVALLTVNGGYGFENSFRPLGDYKFVSRSLNGFSESWHHGREPGNRFRETMLAHVPVPFPQSFVQGIDEQRRDFEGEHGGYLHGEHRDEGFWYYYLYGMLVKEPIGTLALLLMALASTVCSLFRRLFSRVPRMGQPQMISLSVIMIHGLAILCLVSWQTGLNSFFRYLLPAFPFALIWIASASPRLKALIAICVVGAACESLIVFPDSLSFFNIAAGGPERGGQHMLGTNVDWGQDLAEVERWVARHPEATPIQLIHCNFRPVELHDFPSVRPKFCECRFDKQTAETDDIPPPGWYAISQNYLYAREKALVRSKGEACRVQPAFQQYFLSRQPDDCAGAAMLIYHVPAAGSKN